ncbi:hypothetical protein LTR49_027273 [Elasticomyces elasticus]|nr:hypothetical protein LTR49_027273 [Elasticomyces elasticus]
MAVKAAVRLPPEPARFYLALLFSHGRDVNKALSNTEPPILRYASLTGKVTGLIEGSTTLHDLSLTHWLLGIGADPTAACDIDYTPLSVAVRTPGLSAVRLLLRHAKHSHNGHLIYHTTQGADTDETAQMIRLLHQHEKPVHQILWQDTKSYCLRAQFLRGIPLFYACRENKALVASTLLALGADPDKAS